MDHVGGAMNEQRYANLRDHLRLSISDYPSAPPIRRRRNDDPLQERSRYWSRARKTRTSGLNKQPLEKIDELMRNRWVCKEAPQI